MGVPESPNPLEGPPTNHPLRLDPYIHQSLPLVLRIPNVGQQPDGCLLNLLPAKDGRQNACSDPNLFNFGFQKGSGSWRAVTAGGLTKTLRSGQPA
eukprot:1159265-Pelagomonas_calceolata.AAC.4